MPTLQPTHPSYNLVTSEPGPRYMKNTLQSLLIRRVEPYMEDGIIPPNSYKETIRSLHIDAVSRAVRSLPDNVVFEDKAPRVA